MSAMILIVDDSLTVRMNLIETFEAAGLEVTACATIAEARAALAANTFRLVILDVVLPDGDGIDFLKEIREAPTGRDIAVMLLSTESEVRDRIRGLTTGADEYVGKPYEPSYVVARARELLCGATAVAAPDQQTVLVIDDSVTFREALKEALEAASYHVVLAHTGEGGLRLAAALRPAAIIVDDVLPGIDGASVIRRIRLDAALRSSPCLLLTGAEDKGAEIRALDSGADAFVRKEENTDIILARLGAVLRSAGPQTGQRATASLLSPKKILTVDDNATYLQALADALRREEYDVVLARSGEEALELLAVQPVDCILLDVMMPGIDGLEVSRRVKAAPTMRDTPIIMLTMLDERAAMIEGLSAGADDYIAKSSDFEVLRARVLAQLRRKQFEDETRLIREQLLRKELEAVEARAARAVAETRAALVEEQKIRAQMEQAAALLEAAPDPVVIVDRDGRIVMVNARTEIVFGYLRAELLGQPVEMLIPERLHAAHVAQRAPYQENPSPREMGAGRDLFARRKDGSEFAVDVSLSPLATPEGMLVISTVRDVTERTQAEAALRASEGQLRRAQNLAQMGTDLRDLRTGDREWSDETYRILGVSRDSFDPTQENVLALIHPDDRHLIFAARAQTAAGITPGPMEYRIIRPDGSLRHVYREWELIRDDTGEPVQFLGTIQDITERRRTEEQLRQAQKMEAIGNLTGGMAHDFNNLLGIIVGNLGLAQERVGSDGELQELVGESLEAAWRGADLTRRLLAFARRQPLRPTRIDINDLVSNASRLLQRLLGEDIEIVLDLGELIWPVAADPAQLESSVANLATNARDAMPKGGRLIITTANSHLDADYAASYDDVTPGDFAMIAVSDTGTGMPPEIINKIFEPFFTTKGPGKGTGLGLAMVFGFIKQSGGHVTVYSEPGIGTTFRLYLPRAEAEGMLDEVSSARPIARAAGESVLVVEDNAGVRRVVVRQLGELGYRVLESDHATAALDVLAREAVDLMFSDIIMPGGIDGVELARRALERWPALKIVLTSGFPLARIDENSGRLGNLPLLSKPYSKGDLAAALRAALDG